MVVTTKLRLLTTGLVVSCIAIISIGVAWAGQVNLIPVRIGPGAKYAVGSIAAARKSKDGEQFIGCTWNVTATSSYGTCRAVEIGGNETGCTTKNASWLPVFGMINETSVIHFERDNDPQGPKCTALSVTNGSSSL
jgi:hypothetical protein